MTFLEAVKKAIKWSGVRSSEPSTLVDASGLVKNMADMVSSSWKELQLERRDWMWNTVLSATGIITEGNNRFFIRTNAEGAASDDNKLSGQITYDTDTGVGSITAADLDDFQYVIEDCKVGINDDTTKLLPERYLSYVDFKLWPFEMEEQGDEQPPQYYTIASDGTIIVHPVPDDDYRLYFELPRVPQTLEADEDEILYLPEYMQDGIVWRGILYYAMYIQDPGMLELARLRYQPYKKWLEDREMPTVTLKRGALY